jgi:hypothetical protein
VSALSFSEVEIMTITLVAIKASLNFEPQ